MSGDQFGDTALPKVGSDGFEFGAIRESLAYLDGCVWQSVGAFRYQLSSLQAHHDLPFHDAAFLQTLGGVNPYDVPLLCDETPEWS